MNFSVVNERLAVCSWSLQPADPLDLVAKVRATGIHRIQLALDPLRTAPLIWGPAARVLREAGITIVSGMFGCAGENYATLASIRETGGIAPDETWPDNLKNIQATANIAAELGLKLITFHAGFVPHETSDTHYATLLDRLTTVAKIFAAVNMTVGLETGQENAATLSALLAALKCPNVGVNFDPANLILYGQGDPVEAVLRLGSSLRQVHIKDARHTTVPGTWGEEVVAGTGDVDWPEIFRALKKINFTGDLAIEREAGNRRVSDVITARDLVLRLAD